MGNSQDGDMGDVLDGDEVNQVLRETFYRPRHANEPTRRSQGKKKKSRNAKPDHYDVICISLYREDLERLDRMVAELKESGHRKMSRSALIRFALNHVDLSKLPPSY